MNPLQQHMHFYDTVVNPLADEEQRQEVMRRFIRDRKQYVTEQVQEFWQLYMDSKLEHGYWVERIAGVEGLTPFQIYYFPILATTVTAPEAKQILLDSLPLYYINSFNVLVQMHYAIQWTNQVTMLYGFYPPPERHGPEVLPDSVQKGPRE